ncbi:ribbon-helix-helix protein, CopG family [Geodermatophilus sp. DF01-2]|uniref:YfbU family protein n=1 Tax=Geodermatophilus sp. DF01-2 TaxID=2559610 RepID=UPI001073A4DF|nr:YfbU family protein [Geodermatophilus sp. DF01_2]TFV57417.1 ribbon-helix-helix protein, CopG family [Geodermatophilus sp. DF01_2]
MAVLNIRLDDRVRDQLKELADDQGVSLSEYVRDLLMEAVVPVYQSEVEHGDEPPAESMRIADRQVLSLLHRILARVLPEDANGVDGDLEYQLMRAKILEEGYTGEYWYETAGFSTELSKRDCNRVSDILQMFRVVTFSIAHLEKEGKPVAEKLAHQLQFQGFDHNNSLEGHMARYVDFLMRDGKRWTELKPQLERNDNGNSHSPVLDTYLRMLAEYRRIMDSRERGFSPLDHLLSDDELEQIADARVHPSSRRHFRSVVRYDGDAALIKMPSENTVPGRAYEIRDTDRETVLAKGVTGQELLDARRDQLHSYLGEDPERTNIAMVDVSALIQRHSE